MRLIDVDNVITREQLIEQFAQEIAELQRKADIWYYERHNQKQSSWLCDQAYAITVLAEKLGINEEMYKRAYEIYDFRHSGKEGYTLKDGKIVRQVGDQW